MNPDDDIENEELDGLQSYARKGMAQELAKKLGLMSDVPGIDAEPTGEEQPEVQTSAGGDEIDPELLQQILASLGKSQ